MARLHSGDGVRAAAVLLAGMFVTAQGHATTPALQWQGAQRVVILCQVTAASPTENDAVARQLCERVRQIAGRKAPVPVEVAGYGDPALRAPNTVVLLIQAAVTEMAPGRLGLLIAARTDHRSTAEPETPYFGAAPRVAPFTSAAAGAAWDSALAASLGELLPWLRPAEYGELSPVKQERN